MRNGRVTDYPTAVKLTEALLEAQAEHLPQFGQGRGRSTAQRALGELPRSACGGLREAA